MTKRKNLTLRELADRASDRGAAPGAHPPFPFSVTIPGNSDRTALGTEYVLEWAPWRPESVRVFVELAVESPAGTLVSVGRRTVGEVEVEPGATTARVAAIMLALGSQLHADGLAAAEPGAEPGAEPCS